MLVGWQRVRSPASREDTAGVVSEPRGAQVVDTARVAGIVVARAHCRLRLRVAAAARTGKRRLHVALRPGTPSLSDATSARGVSCRKRGSSSAWSACQAGRSAGLLQTRLSLPLPRSVHPREDVPAGTTESLAQVERSPPDKGGHPHCASPQRLPPQPPRVRPQERPLSGDGSSVVLSTDREHSIRPSGDIPEHWRRRRAAILWW